MTGRTVVVALALGLAVVACGSAVETRPRPTAAPSTSTASPTATATAEPTARPTPTPSATATPAPTASPAEACVVEPQTGLLPSDRLTDVQVLGLPGRDIVSFTFEEGSLTPAGPPTGTLEVATPPFTEGPSGLPIDLHGDHALAVVFKGMSLQNDVGQPTYDGPRDITVTDPGRSLRQAVLFDESEGQVGWYIGYDGARCVSLSREGDTVIVAIDFGPGS